MENKNKKEYEDRGKSWMNPISYHAAIYLRLSREDRDLSVLPWKKESNSIVNQKALILRHLDSMPEVLSWETYIDDGYSGLIFAERPDFVRMCNDIYQRKVNMVIVKDLSRLGRDHVETDRYIQRIFPALGVRFVSVMDYYDSLTATGSDRNLILPFKNFMNDAYSRDTGYKIRSSQEALRQSGTYIGSYTPYGYVKSLGERGRLLPDGYAAEVVQHIFAMKLKGKSVSAIADCLNELGVPAPSEYKRMQGISYQSGFQIHSYVQWSAVAVRRILTAPVYTGVLVQGKRETISYKVKKVIARPQEEWSVVEGALEAIISRSDFDRVQRLLLTDTRRSPVEKEQGLFSGLVYCGDCKRGMTRRTTGKGMTYICSSYNKGNGCSRHRVAGDDVERLVLTALRTYIQVTDAVKKVKAERKSSQTRKQSLVVNQQEIQKKQDELKKIEPMKKMLKRDWEMDVITEEEYLQFQEIYEEKERRLTAAVEHLTNRLEEQIQEEKQTKEWLHKFYQSGNLEKLDRLALVSLVERVEVLEDKRIEIVFSYRDTLTRG